MEENNIAEERIDLFPKGKAEEKVTGKMGENTEDVAEKAIGAEAPKPEAGKMTGNTAENATKKAGGKTEENASGKGKVKSRTRRHHSIWTKVWAFLGLMVCTAFLTSSVMAALYLVIYDVYSLPTREVLQSVMENTAHEDARLLTTYLMDGDDAYVLDVLGNRNVEEFELTYQDAETGNTITRNFQKQVERNPENEHTYESGYTINGQLYHYRIFVNPNGPYADAYRVDNNLVCFVYELRFWVYPIGIGAFIAGLFLFIFLMCAAGRGKDSEEPQPCFATYIPFDLELLLLVIAEGGLIAVMAEAVTYSSRLLPFACAELVLFLVCIAILVLFCIDFAIRVKTHHIWHGSLLRWMCVGIGRFFVWIGKGIVLIFKNMPILWQGILANIVVAIVEIFALALCGWTSNHGEEFALLWMLWRALVLAGTVYFSLMLNRLKKAGGELAEGNTALAVDKKAMLPVLREHAENLESVGKGIGTAVEQRMKSERMKTQLITNVSHDLKTPLTSVINYTDLISKEKCDNPKIKEYAEVLGRQSDRLKHLIEDLVEASKASTGNLEVNPEVCEAGMFLSQAAGEYEEKMEASGLQLVIKGAEAPAKIMADPRRMWRVFDNLLNNICKYALPSTRVYLTMEVVDGSCRFSFKNTSAMELDMKPEELMERFVRGDQARNTEGNGLGLSITQSLVQLQQGTMQIDIDGDLFKVILEFPIVE